MRDENERLRKAFSQQGLASEQTSPGAHTLPGATTSDQRQISYQDFYELSQKFAALTKRHEIQKKQTAQYKEALEKAKDRVRQKNETITSWKIWYDHKLKSSSNKHPAGEGLIEQRVSTPCPPPPRDAGTDDLESAILSSTVANRLGCSRRQLDEEPTPSFRRAHAERIDNTAQRRSERDTPDRQSIERTNNKQDDELVQTERESAGKYVHSAKQNSTSAHTEHPLGTERGTSLFTNDRSARSPVRKSPIISQLPGSSRCPVAPLTGVTEPPLDRSSRVLDATLDDETEQQVYKNDLNNASGSSQSTQNDADVANSDALKVVEVSGSSPVWLSERPVKHRRTKKKLLSCTPSRPRTNRQIKQESGTSVLFPARHRPNDSLDLDELSGQVVTPRKRRRMAMLTHTDQWRQTRLEQEATQGRSSSAPLDGHFSEEDTSDRIALTSTRSFHVLGPSPLDLEEVKPATEPDCDNRPASQTSATSSVLQPLSVNEVIPRKRKWTKDDKAKGTVASRINDLAEDDDNLTPKSKPTIRPRIGALDFSRRTQGLLETPSPGRRLLTTSRAPAEAQSAQPSTRKRNLDPKPPSDDARLPAYRPDDVSQQPDVRPEDEPLRSKPLATLTPADFKINPAANHGAAHAFSEVIRGREQRQCLPGCTRAECCGAKFRKMIAIGGALRTPARRLWDTSDASDEQRELEDYLGEGRARLKGMGPREREELLAEARAHGLAQRHGRHRGVFERARTPPGFWRTDMPSTQEDEADRERARREEREVVRERYVEAMRGGGRWLFRDE